MTGSRMVLLLAACAAVLAGCGSEPRGAAGAAGSTGTTAAVTSAGASAAAGGRAVVAAVVDGDTLRLRDGREVRLVQIDAPERDDEECYADRATAALRLLAPPGTRVRLEPDSGLDRVDAYGRLLRYVHVGARVVNVALVRRGAATPWFFRGERGIHAAALMRAARAARAAGRGLWGACPGTRLDPGGPADTGPAGHGGAAGAPQQAACAAALPWNEARAHVGEQAVVTGPVVGTHYAAGSNGAPTFLNVGRDYPDPDRLQVVVWGDDRGRFPTPPERAYAGRTVCVSGEIELYRGVAEIEVDGPSDLVVLKPDE